MVTEWGFGDFAEIRNKKNIPKLREKNSLNFAKFRDLPSAECDAEPVFVNVYGAQESISRNRFGQPM
jgi:hypothetical protein